MSEIRPCKVSLLSGVRSRMLAPVCLVLAVLLSSCFTGIESTPKITQRDIKKQKVTDSPEKLFLADISGQAPADWAPGKVFMATDPRISLIFERTSVNGDSISGRPLTVSAIRKGTSVLGDSQTIIDFAAPYGDTLSYRTNIPYDTFSSRTTPLVIPFTVEKSIVDSVAARLTGKQFYVLPQRRQNEAGRDTVGLRYIPVTISSVDFGDAYYPLRVSFTDENGVKSSLMMTFGSSPSATRNFESLFSFTNPRNFYPQISDEHWELIRHSQVELGMTPQECRLALGSPNDWEQRPSTAGMVERWSYEDGVYLIFVDGLLSRFRR